VPPDPGHGGKNVLPGGHFQELLEGSRLIVWSLDLGFGAPRGRSWSK